MAKMDLTKHRWTVIDGSVFTEATFLRLNDATGKNFAEPQRYAVAFNVGRVVAEQMVTLQNEWYESKGPGFVKKHNDWAEAVGSANWER